MSSIDQVSIWPTEAQCLKFTRWQTLGASIRPNDHEAEDRSSYEEEIDYLKSWLTARVAWFSLDVQLLP